MQVTRSSLIPGKQSEFPGREAFYTGHRTQGKDAYYQLARDKAALGKRASTQSTTRCQSTSLCDSLAPGTPGVRATGWLSGLQVPGRRWWPSQGEEEAREQRNMGSLTMERLKLNLR